MTVENKPKCPACETELVLVEGKIPDKCPKPDCGFLLKGYGPFKQWLSAAMKEAKATAPKEKKDDDDENPFSVLGRL